MPDRYIDHPPQGAAQDYFRADQPLGAGRYQYLLTSNAIHLAKRNAVRPLAHATGLREIYAAPAWPTTGVPSVEDVQWQVRNSAGGCVIPLGEHFVHRYPEPHRWPTVVCSCWAWVLGGGAAVLGFRLFLAPGKHGPSVRGATLSGIGYTTAVAVPAQYQMIWTLTDADVERVHHMPTGGTLGTFPDSAGDLYTFSAWLGGYNTAGAKPNVGSIVGISLYLIAPT